MAQINYRVNAILQTKGDLAAQIAKKTAAVGGLAAKIDSVNTKIGTLGRSMAASAMSTGAAYAKAGLMGAGAAVGAGIGVIAAKSFEANAGTEAMRNTLAGTLQLYNHSANKANQLANNIRVAEGAMSELLRIADAAPGGIDDINVMFQNMLPGARSVTGEMRRIMALTQNLAVFTPTLTNGDFMTSGAQMGRILAGSAGAEMDTWKRLAPVILKAGHEMDKIGGGGKVFGKNLVDAGEKLTMEFNKLSGEQRLALIEKAFSGNGAKLAKMYEESWEGASATFISGWKRIAAAGTQPMFNSLKTAVIKATKGDNALFGKAQLNRFMHAADTIGRLLERPFMRGVKALENAITYLDRNWKAVANSVYHAFQIGAGAIKAALAIGTAKLIAGMAMAGGSMAVGGVTKGIGAVKKGLAVTRPVAQKAADGISGFLAALSFGNNRLFKIATGVIPKLLGVGFAMAPLIIVGGLLAVAFGMVAVVVGGIAAYLISKWDEIAASIRKGLEDGTVTLKPLVIAAMTLWEKLKAVGEALLGGSTGASLMQTVINMATSAINGMVRAVAFLIEITAGFIRFMGKAADMAGKIFGESRYDITKRRADEIMQSKAGFLDKDTAFLMADKEFTAGKLTGPSYAEQADKIASKFDTAAAAFEGAGLKDLNFEEVEQMTKAAENALKKLVSGDSEEKKKVRGATTNIGTLNMNVDLREKDPDRLMRGLFEPIQQLARAPTASAYDGPGF